MHGRVELLLGLPISLGMRGDLTVLCSDLMHINPSYLRALGFPTPGAYRLGIRAGLPLGALAADEVVSRNSYFSSYIGKIVRESRNSAFISYPTHPPSGKEV